MILEGLVLAVGALLIWAAISDFRQMIIPNWIPLSILGLFAAFLVVQGWANLAAPVLPVWSSLATGLVVLAIFAGLFAMGWIGGGDVKMISAMGFWSGIEFIDEFLLLMALAGGVLALFFFFRQSHNPDLEVKVELFTNEKPQKSVPLEEKSNNKRITKANIPYGIAISAAGLFVVIKLFTILPA